LCIVLCSRMLLLQWNGTAWCIAKRKGSAYTMGGDGVGGRWPVWGFFVEKVGSIFSKDWKLFYYHFVLFRTCCLSIVDDLTTLREESNVLSYYSEVY
jgi:hypothetical protein